MAARLASWCRQFNNIFQAASSPANLAKFQKIGLGSSLTLQYRSLHTSDSYHGLEGFFDHPKNWGEQTVKSGAPWTAKQLRIKSNEDLHKLWYVLLKEKNMLLTLEQEAKRQRLQMPSPERLKKVERSMARIDSIVQEREDALRLLQTGQEKGRPGAWRRDIFGQNFWCKFREWPIPWYLNKIYRRKRFYTPPFVDIFVRQRIEKHLRKKNNAKKAKKEEEKRLSEKFPQLSASAQS
ncbi:39S ribosomal protein L47, mitochondrial isoform X1 [Heterodontus francisci]|uniref:39S ribosomal protein L47, mitochondrial isoform X1 n=2 Tax=Heterodontus francisci TaxID=7792 RepID=UPI00355AD362